MSPSYDILGMNDNGGRREKMPKGTNQKFKLYRLAQIMLEKTDNEHFLTMPEIMEELARYEVTADRKSIYADLRDLSVFGIEVEGEPIGNRYHYHVINRKFELPELKLLVDAIQSSKFITEKKSNALIKKLETLVSKYDAQKLQRQVFVSGRIKTMNESIYYNVDAIHHAISENRQIQFQYYQWNVKKEMELRHDGAWYHISPWGLSWDDENYYMIGYDADTESIKYYRVDKMLHIKMSKEQRKGKEHFAKLNMADYAKKSFGMFGGKEQTVKLRVKDKLAGVMIDRFGKDVMMIPSEEGYFTVNVNVHVSSQFLGWVFSLGEDVKIVGPEEVAERMKAEGKRVMRQYEQ
jgi:predicted DNA-binding transcriptional regulator YafY